MEEQIHGLSLRDCAEIMSKDGELKAQHGERAYKPLFEQYLMSRGVDENRWAHSWNGWWTRMNADPSGQLHAKFHMMQQELTTKAHLSDIPDMSQDAKEGVTLDQYAQIMAKSSAGEDMGALVAAAGLGWDQWQRAMAAWNTAMSQDVNHHITTQYGQLYAKYSPGFHEQMQGQVAAIMAADHAQRAAGIPDEPEVEYTFDDMVRGLDDPTPAKRWSAAHDVANRWDIGDRSDPAIDAAARKAYERMVECLARYDDNTVSSATCAISDIKQFAEESFLTEQQLENVRGDIERALARGRERLATHEAAFAPIANKAVPERIQMQTAIQMYTSLVEDASEALAEWSQFSPGAGGPAGGGASASMSSAIAPVSNDGGLLAILKRIPILGAILRLLGL